MPETFLILLAGGIMLAAAVSDPQQVTLLWLRLCGIIALAMAGLSAYFFRAREGPVPQATWIALACVFASILAQLALVQTARRVAQQAFAWIAFLFAIKI